MVEQTTQTQAVLNRVNTPARLLASGLTHQMGVELVSDLVSVETPLDLDGQECENQLVPPEKVPIVQEVANQLLSLTGIAQLIADLRNRLLDLPTLDDVSVPNRGAFENHRAIYLNRDITASLLYNKVSIVNKYVQSQVRINLLLQTIEQLDEHNQEEFHVIKDQLQNWQALLEEILPQLDRNAKLQDLIKQETNKQTSNDNGVYGEIERLRKLMTGERVGGNEQKREKLRIRVVKSLLGSTATAKKNEVASDLANELFATASVINDIRILDRLKGENLDLLRMRELVEQCKKIYTENPNQAETLNQQLINEVAIPITNAIVRLFPHSDSNSPTLIASALYRNEAVCAGKAGILTTIFKLIGLKAKTVSVIKTLDDRMCHAIFTCQVFGSTTLVIDANYNSYVGKSDSTIQSLFPSQLIAQRFIANRDAIPQQSSVLLYTSSPVATINAEVDLSNQTGFYQVRRSSGAIQYFKATIPYPHQVTTDPLISHMSASDHFNRADVLMKLKMYEEAEKHYLEAIRIDPKKTSAHSNLAKLLNKLGRYDEAEVHYCEAIQQEPKNSDVRYNYAIVLSSLGRPNEARSQYVAAVANRNDPLIAWYLTGYASFLDKNRENTEALQRFQEALHLMEGDENLQNYLTSQQISAHIARLKNSSG